MTKELIDKLFEEFEKDKEIIKENLLKVMEVVVLETKDEYKTATIEIKVRRNER